MKNSAKRLSIFGEPLVAAKFREVNRVENIYGDNYGFSFNGLLPLPPELEIWLGKKRRLNKGEPLDLSELHDRAVSSKIWKENNWGTDDDAISLDMYVRKPLVWEIAYLPEGASMSIEFRTESFPQLWLDEARARFPQLLIDLEEFVPEISYDPFAASAS